MQNSVNLDNLLFYPPRKISFRRQSSPPGTFSVRPNPIYRPHFPGLVPLSDRNIPPPGPKFAHLYPTHKVSVCLSRRVG